MKTEQTEPSWLDKAGDLLQAEGYEPGCLFEFHDKIHPSLSAGGVVATSLPPGQPPSSPLDIERVVLREARNGELHGGGQGWPIWITNASKVREYL